MSSMVLLVKNMVCHRCELAVEGILQTAGIAFQKVVTGEIHLEDKISEEQKELRKPWPV